MQLVIIVLKNEKLLKKLISILIEFGLYDSSVFDGEGIENLAAATNPTFSTLRSLFSENYVYNRTILIPVEDAGTGEQLVRLCGKEGIDFSNEDTGIMVSLPCTRLVPDKE